MEKIPPEIQLHIELKRKEDRKEYEGLFSSKWVEKMAIWSLYLIGAMILTAIILSAVDYIK